MPVYGIGTYSLHNETCFNAVYTALKNGYRLIDTAYMYDNEEEVGRAVRQAVSDGTEEHVRSMAPAEVPEKYRAVREKMGSLHDDA